MMRKRTTYTPPAEIVLGKTPDMVVPEIKIRYSRSEKKKFGGKITSPADVYEFIRGLYPKGEIQLQEQFIVLYLNQANKIIGYYRHTKGTITATLADIRIILGVALKSGAVSIVLAHNHPSGNPKPSASDELLTKKLKTAAESMEITVLDHLIVTKDSFFSFADEGLLGVPKTADLSAKARRAKEDDRIQQYVNTVMEGDVMKQIKKLPDSSIDCVITSPPYWQLRDYGFKGQWGLERTYMAYLENLLCLMDEIYRVLKPEGTVWVNLGDSYFGSGNGQGVKPEHKNLNSFVAAPKAANNAKENNLPKKCMALIPHRFAIGCIERGWIGRNDIIWAKPNSLPEAVTDRFSKKHEHIFFFVKNQNYFFDLDVVREPYKTASFERARYKTTAYGGDAKNRRGPFGKGAKQGSRQTKIKLNPLGKNPGDVTDFWVISNKPNSDEHYAAFNKDLITKPILAGCPEGGIVLDPFCGSGTTGVRAVELGRKFIGIDAKKEYCAIARKNIAGAVRKKENELRDIQKELREMKLQKAA